MNIPTALLSVTRPEETQGFGSGPSSVIPTLGHIASSFDVYRTVGIESVINRPDSWAFTDLDSCAALGRIVDGPISCGSDINKAESAVRAALLYEFIDVIVPCVKADHGNGLISYTRFDNKIRNKAAFETFESVPCRDHLLATEYVKISNGEITESSVADSGLVGKDSGDARAHLDYLNARSAEVAVTLPIQLEAATHYTGDSFSAISKQGASGFISELYSRVYRPWVEIAQAGPQLHVNLKLPPFLAIILSRANSREDVPTILKDLRKEMQPIRADLIKLNLMINACIPQNEITAHALRVSESFDSIVPEALLTPSDLRWRTLVSVFNFIKPVKQLYTIAVNPLSADSDKYFEFFQSATSAVQKDSRVVSRFVAASNFAKLLRSVGSVRDMMTSHFSKEEQLIIHQYNARK